MKHSPTPWKIDFSTFYPHPDDTSSGIIRDRTGQGIITVTFMKDAQIVRAAPDLYKALKPLLKYALDVDRTGLSKSYQKKITDCCNKAMDLIIRIEGRE